MGDVGGTPRQYTGRDSAPTAIKWKCACGAENVSRFEDGCPACGAGTPQIAVAAPPLAVPDHRLIEEIVGEEAARLAAAGYWLGLPFLTGKARMSIAVALAHYADHGAPPSVAELPRVIAQGWARRLAASVEEDEAARAAMTPDEPEILF